MNKLLNTANEYISTCDWKIFALMKLCLVSLGGILGICLPKKARKPFLIIFIIGFIASYIPLMLKLIKMYIEE